MQTAPLGSTLTRSNVTHIQMTQPRRTEGAGRIAHSGRALNTCASRDRTESESDDKSEQARSDYLNPPTGWRLTLLMLLVKQDACQMASWLSLQPAAELCNKGR